MASKKVRLPSAKLVEDSFNDVDERSEATFATERTSGLISDVFETDQVSTKTTTERKTTTIDPPFTKEDSIAKEESASEAAPSASAGNVNEDPSSYTKSPATSMISSEEMNFRTAEEETSPLPIKKTIPAKTPKTIDYTKKCNNVSIKHLRSHQSKMRLWHHCTLETLIDQQDCAVEAVKLEWLLRLDVEAQTRKKSQGLEPETPSPFEAVERNSIIELTPKEHRRLYDLLRY